MRTTHRPGWALLALALIAASAEGCRRGEAAEPNSGYYPNAPAQPGAVMAPGYLPPGGYAAPVPSAASQEGLATYYGDSLAGNKTASGQVYDPNGMTAAHRELPFGTWVEVTRASNGRRVMVRITDRGPFGSEKRIIDLSRRAAEQLDMIRDGVVEVRVRPLSEAEAASLGLGSASK